MRSWKKGRSLEKKTRGIRYAIYIIVAVVASGLYITFFFVPPQEKRLEALIAKHLSQVPSGVLLKDMASFQWDYVCLIGPYDSKDSLKSDFKGFSEKHRRQAQDSIGLNMDYVTFVDELPRMKPLMNSFGIYYKYAFVFLKNGKRVKAWRFTQDQIPIDGYEYSWESPEGSGSVTTCLQAEEAMLQPQIGSLDERFLVFNQAKGTQDGGNEEIGTPYN